MQKDLQDLIIKGPFVISNERNYRIYKRSHGNSKKSHHTFVTPHVCISSSNKEHGFISLSVDNIKSDTKITEIVRYVKVLETCLQHQKDYMQIPSNCIFRSCLNDWYGNQYLQCKTYHKQMDTYDYEGNIDQNGISKLSRGSLVKVLLWLKGVYINNEHWGIQLIVLQIRVYDISPPTKCVIMDDVPKEDTDTDKSVNIDKYRHMQTMGVPEAAIRQKMTLDGVNSELLSGAKGNCNAPKTNIKLNAASLLKGISSISLKKASPSTSKPKKTCQSHNQLVPSLEDILRIKNGLSSVKNRSSQFD